MKNISLIGLLLVLFISSGTIYSQTAKYSNEFLNIGVGARALGMSNTMVATANDVTAGFWNPAALTSIDSRAQFSAMHAEWFAGIAQYDYISFGRQLNQNKNSFGSISLVRFGIDQIPYTINLIGADGTIDYDNVSEFSAADYAFLLSYGQNLGQKGWRIGGNAKVIHRSVGRFGKAWGFGIDAGLFYQGDKLCFGLMLRDISTTFNAWSFNLTEEEKLVFEQTGNIIPVNTLEQTLPRISLGIGYKMQLGEKNSLLLAADVDINTDGERNTVANLGSLSLDPHLGLEFSLNNTIFLRGGVGNLQYIKDAINPDQEDLSFQPNAGIGIKLGRIQLDYALANVGEVATDLLNSHIFSLTLNFAGRAESTDP
ncbi:MAG: PorV/PorQ family protein [Bacteroidota bacterium]